MFYLILLLAVGLFSHCKATEVFYVTPALGPVTQRCHHAPCHTLDQYAQNTPLFAGHTNISLIFFEGVHDLSSNFVISREKLTLCANGSDSVTINMKNDIYMYLEAISELLIADITVRSSGISMTVTALLNVSLVRVELENVPLILFSTQSISINECSISDSSLYFILTYTTSDITITDTTLSGPTTRFGRGLQFCTLKRLAPLQYHDALLSLSLSLALLQCNYDAITLSVAELPLHNSSNILAYLNTLNCSETKYFSPGISCNILVQTFRRILDTFTTSPNIVLKIHSCLITQYNYGLYYPLRYEGDGEMVITDTTFDSNDFAINVENFNKISVERCTVSNTGHFGVIFKGVKNASITDSHIVESNFGVTNLGSRLMLRNTTISGNRFGVNFIPISGIEDVENASTLIDNCTITENTLVGVAPVNIPQGMILRNCRFYENQGSAIYAYQSTFELQGETIFEKNKAERGGGLTLFNSTVIFGPESNTAFIKNSVEEVGGAIYIETLSPILPEILIAIDSSADERTSMLTAENELLKQSCFYQSGNGSHVSFTGNTAPQGGMDIYGATLYSEDCSITKNTAFSLDESSQTTLSISSDPTRVCFCTDNVPRCEDNIVQNETRYPGENFTVSVVLTGYYFGRVAGPVYANVLGGNRSEIMDDNQHIQQVKFLNCSDLMFALKLTAPNETNHTLTLTAQDQFTQAKNAEIIQKQLNSTRCQLQKSTYPPCTALLTTPVYISVTLEDCPLGFKLNNTTGMCDCDEFLDDGTVTTCELRNRTGYITREGTVWVGVDTSENNTDIYYWHRYCPRDHCNSSQISIALRSPDLTSPDTQCSSNRAGVLCGRCQANYSLQLGGNKCHECKNNNYLALLIVFAVFGILLVALIKLLDLTVSSGTINGLIFYANVVWSNNAILFPTQNICYYIITVPIAWINLDFGIEACFSENLDQLTKTGLQFVFPVYIWCIAGLIILISRYSIRATKLFGNNSVSVLATLFLLSYGKLFRNITDVFAYGDINKSDGASQKVWSLDGNIKYATCGHIALIIFAIIFIILIMGFTLLLLLEPFLRAMSHLRLLCWINTLQPFLDAFYGPFKDKKRNQVWTGILLVSRVLILIVLASTSTHSPNANILLMTIIATILLLYSAFVDLLYKKLYSSILEMLYLFNLIILGAAFLFYQTLSSEVRHHDKLNPAAALSVCVALFQFLCTLIFHITKKILSIKWLSKKLEKNKYFNCFREFFSKKKKSINSPEVSTGQNQTGPAVEAVNQVYDESRFRDSILSIYEDDKQ